MIKSGHLSLSVLQSFFLPPSSFLCLPLLKKKESKQTQAV